MLTFCFRACVRLNLVCLRRWIMFYEAVAADNKRSIGMAVSKDGVRDWQRLGRPVLEAGQPGSWDAGGVCSPSVVSMAGKLIQIMHGLTDDCADVNLPFIAMAI